jgi:hypothetical protein
MNIPNDEVTFTHVGHRLHVGHIHSGAKLWGHRLPRTGQRHALNGGPTHFTALCGEAVSLHRYTEFGEDAIPNVRPVTDAEAGRITCKRCLRITGSVQLKLHFNPLLPKPLAVIAGGQSLPLREAVQRMLAGTLSQCQAVACENGVQHENVRVERDGRSIRLSSQAGLTILTADPDHGTYASW